MNPCWRVKASPEHTPASKWIHIDVMSHWHGGRLNDVDMKEMGYTPVKSDDGFYWAVIDMEMSEVLDVDDVDDVLSILPPVKMVGNRYIIGEYAGSSVGRGTALRAIRDLFRVCGENTSGLYSIPSSRDGKGILALLTEKGEKA